MNPSVINQKISMDSNLTEFSNIHNSRVNCEMPSESLKGDRIVYWMHASHRSWENPALEYSVKISNESKKPLDVLTILDSRYPEANRRSFKFLLEGLNDVNEGLDLRGIHFSIRTGDTVTELLTHLGGVAALVTDFGYLHHHKKWYNEIHQCFDKPICHVESNVVVPVTQVTNKEEWSAATIRRKINPLLELFLNSSGEMPLEKTSRGLWDEGCEWKGVDNHLNELDMAHGADPSPFLRGGQKEAFRLFSLFLHHNLPCYSGGRNDPMRNCVSDMSPYLHFGQISPISLASKVFSIKDVNSEAFLEQLIVRRELAINFVHYNNSYDRFEGLPEWCKTTLEQHKYDQREYNYNIEELEQGKTHDPYWNAAQRELLSTGKMHNYMRMYWGKKIIEWSENPELAFENTLRLNNRYGLDGRDANSYAGVAWCFGKHDRPWKERPTFGKIRYMNAKGLERKFDMVAYVNKTLQNKEMIENIDFQF